MEELQTIEPPQQQDPPIKKLYNGLFSDGKYTKSFDEFRKQYSTPEAIDKLYNGLHEDNDYTKSKEEFQQQYFTEVKKKSGSNDLPPVSVNGLSNTPKAETVTPVGQLPEIKNSLERYGIKEPSIPKEQDVNQPISTTSVQPKITASYDDWVEHNQEVSAKKKELRKQAVDNAAMKVLKNKGVIKPEEEGKALNLSQFQQLTTEKKRLQDQLDNGDATFAIKDGEVGLKKTIGFVDALIKGNNRTSQANDEAANFAEMNAAQKVDFLNQKQTEAAKAVPSEYIGERPSDLGSIGQLAGENAIPLLKGTAGAVVGAGLAGLAPETGGLSLAGAPAAMSFLFTANDAKNHGIQTEVTRRYDIGLRELANELRTQNPNITDEELNSHIDANRVKVMEKAEQGTLAGGLTGIAQNALLLKSIKTPLSNLSKGVIGKSISKAIGNTVYGAAAIAGTEGLKLAEGNLEGVKTTPKEIAKAVSESFTENLTTLGALHVMTGAVTGVLKLPNIIKSTFKYALSEANPIELKNALEANVKAGTITPEVAEKTAIDIEQYKVALSKTPNGLSPESEASVAGLIQAKDKLTAEMKTKDDTAKPYYEEKIAGINEQIQKTVNTGKPYAHEIDEISGDKYTEPKKEDTGITVEPPQTIPEPITVGGETESSTQPTVKSEEVKRIIEPSKPISEMNSDELYNHAVETRNALNKQDKEFENKTEKEKQDAGYYNVVDNVEDLRDASQRVNFVENSENIKDLANSVKSVLTNFDKNNPSETTLAILNAAKKKAAELGINTNDLIKEVIKSVGEDYKDKDDAEFMMRNAMDKITGTKSENKPIQNEENKAAEVVDTETPISTPNEQPNETIQTTGEGTSEENKVGVSHESLSKLSEKLGLAQPSRGDYIEPSQYAERGRQLLNNGASLDEVDNTSNDLHDRISIARAHLEDLVSNADKIAKSEGIKSEEYKNAVNEIEKYYVDKVKKLGTLAHRAFVSLQGERDLNTGSFTVVKKEFENNQGSKATPEQEQKINDLVKANNDLKQQLDALDKRLIEETEKNINAEKQKPKLSEKAKKIANTVRRLKLSRPNTFSAATPASLVWDGAVEVAAKIIEASGSIADAVENGIEHIRNSEWYKGLSDDKKNNAEKDFEDAVNNKREKTSEEKRVENLEKQLKDLQEGKIKPDKDKIVRTEREKALIKQIKEEKEALGLNDKIKPVKGSLPVDENISKVNDLISKFVDKKGNKFTPDEAKSIWDYAKSEYLNKGVDYRDMISYVANDLGLSFDQVYHAITTTKTKPISDAAWRKNADLRMSQIKTKDYVDKANRSGLSKAYHIIADPFRSVAVFGHGHIFVGTHAGMTLFDLPRAHYTIKAFINGVRNAYGNTATYERRMAVLKSDPNYTIADRAGLQNNPNETNSDDYQKFSKGWGKALSKIGLTGVKGFNAIKVLRQNLFNAHFNKLNAAQKADPSVAESIAHLVNNATGATNLTLPKWTQEVSFAGNMEAARWEKLTANPLNATKTALKAIITPDKVTDAEKVFAKVWASRVGWQIATYAGILAVNAAIQNTLNPKNKVNLTRPSDPDYLKMKVADKDVNMTSGMLGTIGFITKLVHESGESQKELKGDTRLKAFGKSAATYGRGKLSPFYATIADLVTQQDFARNPLPFSKDKPTGTAHTLTWGEYAWQKAPIPVADAAKTVYEEMQANGMSKPHIEQFFSGLATMVETSSTGFRVNDSYKKKYEINFSEGIQKFVDDKKIEIPSPKQTYTEDKEEVTIPDDKYEEYKANRAKRIENDLTNLKDNPPVNETYQEAVKKIVERANKNARSEVVGVVNKNKPEGYFKNDRPLPVHAVHK